VTVRGWVRTRRDSKAGFSFVQVNDGSCLANLQVVADQDLANYSDQIRHLTTGCSVRCHGTLVESRGQGQASEVKADEIEVLGWVEDPDRYPIQPKHHSFEFLRTVAHLRPRTNTFGAVTRTRHAAARAIHDYFDRNGFCWVNTPIITSSDAEGAGELFRVSTLDLASLPRQPDGKVDFSRDFFGRETFLTVSGQLNVETYCSALSNVYTFGPTFRAEKSKTRRHLTEFWMLEPEVAFMDLDGAMDLAEGMMCHIVQSVLKNRRRELETLERDISKLEMIKAPFPRIHYNEAADILEKESVDGFKKGADFGGGDETILTKKFETPIFVHRFPKKIKAFYMKEDPADDVSSLSFDMLAPEGYGEVIGAGQREESIEVLERKIKEHGLEQSVFDWYLDLRKFGSVPHSGFGIGIERCTTWLCGIQHVRETIPFPRMLNRISP